MVDFSSAHARVQRTVEETYRQFASPAPDVIQGCPCCIDKRGVDVLLTRPLRQLRGTDLWSYVSGLFYTVGSERDFKYLLPRIFDVAINDRGNSNDPEIVLTKLALADWQSWPATERQVVEQLIDAWFEFALARDLSEAEADWIGWETESVLCGIARSGLPLAPWLGRLQEPDAAPVLEDLQRRYPNDVSAFWEDAPAGLKELSDALT